MEGGGKEAERRKKTRQGGRNEQGKGERKEGKKQGRKRGKGRDNHPISDKHEWKNFC